MRNTQINALGTRNMASPAEVMQQSPVAGDAAAAFHNASTARSSIAQVALGSAPHLPVLVDILRTEGVAHAATSVACFDALVEFTGGSGNRSEREAALVRLGTTYAERVNAVVASGALPAVASALHAHASTCIDAAVSGCKVIRNVGSTHGRDVLEAGAIPSAVAALNSSNASVSKIAADALYNAVLHFSAGREAAIAAGAPEAAIATLRAHAGDTAVALACISLLSEMSEEPENEERIVDLGAPAAIVAAMQAHPSDEAIARGGCVALYRMSFIPAGKQALIDARAPATILAAMRKLAGSAAIAEHGCLALGNAGQLLAGKKASVSLGAPDVVVALMRLHSASSAAVAHAGLRVLGALAIEYPAGQLAVVEAGGLSVAVDAMRMHPTSRDVVLPACGVIVVATASHEAGQEAAVQARAPAALVSAMRAFSSDVDVVHAGCTALAHIALSASGKKAAIAADAPAAITAALRSHGDVAGVAVHGCWALVSLQAGPVDAAAAIVAVMAKHPGVEDVARLGCCALSLIALLPGGKKALAEANAAAAIKVALRDHAGSAGVLEWGRVALANATATGPGK